jgi:hypothetical protein
LTAVEIEANRVQRVAEKKRATSAPSERLFSHAGLTIARDRASMLPENAEELIFLKQIWPVIEENRKKNRNLEWGLGLE